MTRVVVIGAGVGGLATAAALARAGLDVTVLEAHVYAGGCAGTFFHQGFRFDAGATLAGGFYPGGPMDILARTAGIDQWPAHPSAPALVVHLPDGRAITRWTDDRRFLEHREAFGSAGDKFWRWQESTADALWDLALRLPSWPPQTAGEAGQVAGVGLAWLGSDLRARLNPALASDAFRPLAAHLAGASDSLRLFIDAQLLIAAQATSLQANALFGASALDLPRRGVVHLDGGMGAIAGALVAAIRRHGGVVHFRQQVTGIRMDQGRPAAVRTRRNDEFPADIVVANLPPGSIAALLGEQAPRRLKRDGLRPVDGWGAFMAYVGLDDAVVPPDWPLHHQVVVAEPMSEGNTVFMSLSPAWDAGRAPAGRRALTISTHTHLAPWWELHRTDCIGYEARRRAYLDAMLAAAERALPGVRDAAKLVLPGTPVTFHRFTRRDMGWVGGIPQTSLFRTWAPRLAPGLWMVGDSIFPGQSTAAVALGGLRVANAIAEGQGIRLDARDTRKSSSPPAPVLQT